MNDAELIKPHGSRSPSRRAEVWLSLIVLAAAGVRLMQAARFECISRDGAFFVRFARELAVDPRLYMREESKQPGYSFAILGAKDAIGAWLSSDPVIAWERCGQLIALIGGIAVVPLVYLLGRRIFDPAVGLIAAGLAAVWSPAVDLSADVLSDMPHLALYLAAVLCVLAFLKSGRLLWIPIAGVSAGIAYLFRLEALGLPLASTAILLAPPIGLTRRRILAVAALLLSFAATVAPYVAVTGTLTHKKSIPQLLDAPDANPESAAMGREFSVAADAMKSFLECGRYVLPLLAVIGVFSRAAAPDRTARNYVVLLGGFQVVAVLLRGRGFGEISTRYMIVPVALALPWAARGLYGTADWLVRRRVLRIMVGTAIIILLAGPLRHAPQRGKLPLREAGNWLRANTTTDARILVAPKLSPVTFYADRRDAWPATSTESLSARLGEIDAAGPLWFADQPERPVAEDENGRLLAACRTRIAGKHPRFEAGKGRDRVAVYSWAR